MKKTSILILLSFFSCSTNTGWYNMEEHPSFKDDDVTNDLNLDNKIFKAGKIFRYDYSYTDIKGNDLTTVAKFNERCKTDRTIDCVDWVNKISDQVIYSEDEYPIEYIQMYVYRTKGHISLSEDQTIIKYDYFNKNGKVLFGEQTGVIEDSEMIFLHPPRMFGFAITELNPFPILKRGEMEWESNPAIPADFLNYTKLYNTNESAIFNVKYKSNSNTVLNIKKLGKLQCKIITAVSEGQLGKTYLRTYFNEEFGFVKLEYKNIDSSKLTLTLTEAL